MAKKGVTHFGDDVSDVGKTRALRDRDIGDEIATAYPEQLALHLMWMACSFLPFSLNSLQAPSCTTGQLDTRSVDAELQ